MKMGNRHFAAGSYDLHHFGERVMIKMKRIWNDPLDFRIWNICDGDDVEWFREFLCGSDCSALRIYFASCNECGSLWVR